MTLHWHKATFTLHVPVHRTHCFRSSLRPQPRFAVEPGSTKVDARLSPNFHMTVACDGMGRRDFASGVPGIFATYSLQAFLNKKQGISPLHANLVQTSPPRRHDFNESLQ